MVVAFLASFTLFGARPSRSLEGDNSVLDLLGQIGEYNAAREVTQSIKASFAAHQLRTPAPPAGLPQLPSSNTRALIGHIGPSDRHARTKQCGE